MGGMSKGNKDQEGSGGGCPEGGGSLQHYDIDTEAGGRRDSHTLRRRDFNPGEGSEGGQGPSWIYSMERWVWMFRNQKLCVRACLGVGVRREGVRWVARPPCSGDGGGGGAFTRKAGWRTDLGEEAERTRVEVGGPSWGLAAAGRRG